MKLTITSILALSAISYMSAQTPSSSALPPTATSSAKVRHVIGLDTVKRNATGTLTVQNGDLLFDTGKSEQRVPVTSIDDIFIGTETTQSGGKTGRVVKTAAIAAPYESGKALTILMRTKVDILTVAFHDPQGAVHGAIFALPIGQAEPMRTQLIQGGAHVSATTTDVSQRSQQ
jgi:hypothetical protein